MVKAKLVILVVVAFAFSACGPSPEEKLPKEAAEQWFIEQMSGMVVEARAEAESKVPQEVEENRESLLKALKAIGSCATDYKAKNNVETLPVFNSYEHAIEQCAETFGYIPPRDYWYHNFGFTSGPDAFIIASKGKDNVAHTDDDMWVGFDGHRTYDDTVHIGSDHIAQFADAKEPATN